MQVTVANSGNNNSQASQAATRKDSGVAYAETSGGAGGFDAAISAVLALLAGRSVESNNYAADRSAQKPAESPERLNPGAKNVAEGRAGAGKESANQSLNPSDPASRDGLAEKGKTLENTENAQNAKNAENLEDAAMKKAPSSMGLGDHNSQQTAGQETGKMAESGLGNNRQAGNAPAATTTTWLAANANTATQAGNAAANGTESTNAAVLANQTGNANAANNANNANGVSVAGAANANADASVNANVTNANANAGNAAFTNVQSDAVNAAKANATVAVSAEQPAVSSTAADAAKTGGEPAAVAASQLNYENKASGANPENAAAKTQVESYARGAVVEQPRNEEFTGQNSQDNKPSNDKAGTQTGAELKNAQSNNGTGAAKTEPGSGLGANNTAQSSNVQNSALQNSTTQYVAFAPVQSAQEAVPLASLQDRVLQEIRYIYQNEGAGNRQAQVQLKLHPAQLGELTVRLFFQNGDLTAHFYAANNSVKEVLETSMQQLRTALEQQDLKLSEASVFVGGGNEQKGQQQSGFRPEDGGWEGTHIYGDNGSYQENGRQSTESSPAAGHASADYQVNYLV